MKRFLHLFWTLIRLRYQLIWARARTSPGRVALLALIYLFFLAVGVFIGVFGLAAAVASVELGKGEQITRSLLSGLHVSAVMTSIFFGMGARAAFSEPVLRRFPLTSIERIVIRHLIGLIDPVWFLLTMSAFGLAVGFALMGRGSLSVGLIAATLFVVSAYLTAVLVLTLVDRAMQSPLGAAILGTLGLAALSFSGIGMVWLTSPHHPERLRAVDLGFYYAPSGLTATLMGGAVATASIAKIALLAIWCVLLFALVGLFERRKKASLGPVSKAFDGSYDFDAFYDRVAGVLGRRHAPLVSKALRYYLRSNRVRLGLATTPIFALASRLISQSSFNTGIEFYFTLAIFSFVGFSGPSSISLNQFGSDGDGVGRYAILPVTFAAPVHAGNVAALLLGAFVIPPTLVLWMLVTSLVIEWRMITMLCGSSVAGLFIFNGLALWTTVLSPRRSEFTNMLSNRLPLGGNLVVGGGLLVIFGLNLMLSQMKLETVLELWWVSLTAALFGVIFYLVCWLGIEGVAERRRAKIIEVVAG